MGLISYHDLSINKDTDLFFQAISYESNMNFVSVSDFYFGMIIVFSFCTAV